MWCYLFQKILQNEIWDFCRICLWSYLAVKRLRPVKLLSQQLPTFLLFRDRRSVAQQCWKRLHSSSTSVGVTHAHYTWSPYKVLWIVSFPRCTAGPNNVGSCCVRLHLALRSVHKSMTIMLMIVQSSFHSELTDSHTFGGWNRTAGILNLFKLRVGGTWIS